jgi:hypothetical protein
MPIDIATAKPADCIVVCAGPLLQLGQITAVTLDGIRRETSFDCEVVEKELNQW